MDRLVRNEIPPLVRVCYIKCTLCHLVRIRASDRVRKEICGNLSGVVLGAIAAVGSRSHMM